MDPSPSSPPSPIPAPPIEPAAKSPLAATPAPTATGLDRKKVFIVGTALMLLCLILRLINLLALPIFGDESIYLRWSQLIRGEGVSLANQGFHLWISLVDPKPPLHFWLIAPVYHWTSDPLVSARLLSVLAGVLCVPLMMAIGTEFGHVMNHRIKQISPRGLGIVAALLAIFCPFLAFYQRLATADALFTTESLLIAWLSLRWARLAFERLRRRSWLTALVLGLALGAGLMTRQGVSYTICAMPVGAWLASASSLMDARAKRRRTHAFEVALQAPSPADPGDAVPLPRPPTPSPKPGLLPGEEKLRRLWFRGILQLSAAALLAGLLWLPYLTAQLEQKVLDSREAADKNLSVTRADLLAEVKRRVFYKASFTEASSGRLALTERNAYVTFVPAWNSQGNVNSGWLPLYMTVLVFAMCLVGFVYTAIRQPKVAFLIFLWLLLLLAPVICLIETIYSRYVLAAVPPLLFAGAYLLGDTTALLARSRVGRVVALLLWTVILALPLREMHRQLFAWKAQTLTEQLIYRGQRITADRYQYLTGWTAGAAVRDAIDYLQGLARAHPDKPLVVITTNGWGTPADAAWVYLSREPNVQLYYIDGRQILRRGPEAGTFLLKDDKFLFPAPHPVRFAAGAPVYLVANDPVHGDVDMAAGNYYREPRSGNPNLPLPKTFYGIEGPAGEGVAVFPVPRQ